MSTPNFLHAVAADLYQRYGEGISLLNIVLPSQRARLFFTDALTKQINRPLWQPVYLSAEDLVKKISPLKQADDYSLLVDLYKVYTHFKKSVETFDHFYFWGEILLTDFDAIDKHRIKAEDLFKNLAAQKTFEGDFSFLESEQIKYIQSFWSSFDPKGESKLQHQFIEVWDILYPVYNNFKKLLADKGEAYEGMLYRDAAERISNGEVSGLGDKKYVFIGFNALNECEKSLFVYLKNVGQADFYYDYDDYYLHNPVQEAGYFLRSNISQFPMPQSFSLDSSFSMPKQISITSVPSDVLQSKILPTLLAEMDAPLNRKTAIILADENLLLPVLYSLPDSAKDVNITIGFPLKQTAVYSLAELLIRLQRGCKSSGKTSRFYHKDVLSVLNHQYIKLLAGTEPDKLKTDIVDKNIVYVEQDFFKAHKFLCTIFTPVNDYMQMADYLIDMFSLIAKVRLSGDDDDNALRREYIYHIVKALNRLKKSIDEGKLSIGLPVFLSLLRSVFSSLRIPFTGQPVKGLQIMGLLETRTLDFDNLIILSLNEGILPRTGNVPSFVPYHLRRGFGLPVVEQQEAIYAYYFYRLLQRAKKISLVYSSKTDEARTGEMSRYLYQLKFESGHKIAEQSLSFRLNFNETQPIIIEKNNDVMASLQSYWGKNATLSLSPSALSSFIKCPLQFYFRYIARINKTEEVQEELSINVFGNILHNVMEKLYMPYRDKAMTQKIVMAIYEDNETINQLLNESFAKEYYHSESLPDDFEENGRLVLDRDVIEKYIKGMLLFDARNTPFIPVSFEERIVAFHTFLLNRTETEVKLSGFADRIDRYNGVIRIIDYKTGGGKGKKKRVNFNGVESLFSTDPDKRNSEAFQTFLYALMYISNHKPDEPVLPALYFVRDMYDADFNACLVDDKTKKMVDNFLPYSDEFTALLNDCLANLFDSSIPFTQTSYTSVCTQSCAYRAICRR